MIFTSSSCSSRILKKSSSGVLAALRGSTYRSVRLASSLAAALLDGLFEHPAWCSSVVQDVRTSEVLAHPIVFPQLAMYYPFQWIVLSFFLWPPVPSHL